MSDSAERSASILLTTGQWLHGNLVQTYSGEGQTDGLLHVRETGQSAISNVYERHIVLLRYTSEGVA